MVSCFHVAFRFVPSFIGCIAAITTSFVVHFYDSCNQAAQETLENPLIVNLLYTRLTGTPQFGRPLHLCRWLYRNSKFPKKPKRIGISLTRNLAGMIYGQPPIYWFRRWSCIYNPVLSFSFFGGKGVSQAYLTILQWFLFITMWFFCFTWQPRCFNRFPFVWRVYREWSFDDSH